MQARQLQNSTSKLQIINAHLYPEIQTIAIMTTQVESVDHCQMAIIIISIHTHTTLVTNRTALLLTTVRNLVSSLYVVFATH